MLRSRSFDNLVILPDTRALVRLYSIHARDWLFLPFFLPIEYRLRIDQWNCCAYFFLPSLLAAKVCSAYKHANAYTSMLLWNGINTENYIEETRCGTRVWPSVVCGLSSDCVHSYPYIIFSSLYLARALLRTRSNTHSVDAIHSTCVH